MTLRTMLFAAAVMIAAAGCRRVLDQKDHDAVDGTFSGKVLRSTHPRVVEGSRCEGTLRRERNSPTAHVTMTCNDIVMYDGDGRYDLSIGDPTRRDDDSSTFADMATSDVDRTPGLTLTGENNRPDGSGGTLNLWDVETTIPPFEIAIAL
jgi:hypothetical protein